MDTFDLNLLEQEVPGWPKVGPIIADSVPAPSESMEFLTPKAVVGQELLSSLTDKVIGAVYLPRNKTGAATLDLDSLTTTKPEVESVFDFKPASNKPELAITAGTWIANKIRNGLVGDRYFTVDHTALSNQSDTPLNMSESINPPVVEATVTPATPKPANLTPAEQRKADLEARRAAVKAEAKALVVEERALAKHTRDVAKAKVKALLEVQKEELKTTTKKLLEITTMINRRSCYGLNTLEISFSAHEDYFEVTDIGFSDRHSEMASKIETIEISFPGYFNYAPQTFLFKQSEIATFDKFLQLVEEHVSVYIPADVKVTDGLLVIKPREPLKERVLVYLKQQKVEPQFLTAASEWLYRYH